MKDTIYSESTRREYVPSECVRLTNMKQWALYMNMGVEILDFYPSKDFKTGKDIMVFIVNKKDSQEAYKVWQATRDEMRLQYDL